MRIRPVARSAGIALALVGAGLPLAAQSVGAVAITVTSTADDGPGTLRRALVDIKDNGVDDTIDLAPGSTYSVCQPLLNDDPGQTTVIRGNGATIRSSCDKTIIVNNPDSGLELRDLTLTDGGEGDSGALGGAVDSVSGTQLVLDNVTAHDNHAEGDGGVIWSTGPSTTVRIHDSVLEDNDAVRGGAVYAQNGVSLQIEGSTLRRNTATGTGGGAVWTTGTVTANDSAFADNTVATNITNGGGAIIGDTVNLTRSSLTGNTSGNFQGGAVSASTITAVSTTVSDNDAGTNGTGGLRAGIISLKFSTVTHNRGRDLDGLISLTAFGSIVGGGAADDLGHQCAATQATTSQGYNVSDDAECGFGGGTGDQSPVADLGLLHLDDNGAPGLSRHPAFGGILIDAVPPGGNCGVTVTDDQRSRPRPLPLGGVANCDIGAVEFDRSQLPSHPFTDVAAWIDAAVDWIWFYGHATGYDDDTYRPANPLTRAQYVRMLYRLAGSPDVSEYPAHGLGDVPAWVRDAVTWAADDPDGGGPLEAPMTGFPDDTFRPDDEVTRAQAVRALYRLTGSPDLTGFPPHGFSDVPAWVQDAVTWAADDPDDGGPLDKIIEGFPGGTFRPNDLMNRGQSTRMLFRWDAAFN